MAQQVAAHIGLGLLAPQLGQGHQGVDAQRHAQLLEQGSADLAGRLEQQAQAQQVFIAQVRKGLQRQAVLARIEHKGDQLAGRHGRWISWQHAHGRARAHAAWGQTELGKCRGFLCGERGRFKHGHVGHDALRVGGRAHIVGVVQAHGVAHFMGPHHPFGQGVAKQLAVQKNQGLAHARRAAANEPTQGHLGAAALGNGIDQHQLQAPGLAGHGRDHGGVVGHAQAGMGLHAAHEFKAHAGALAVQLAADLVQPVAHALGAVARQTAFLPPPHLHRHRALGR